MQVEQPECWFGSLIFGAKSNPCYVSNTTCIFGDYKIYSAVNSEFLGSEPENF